jgi:hypothetical protein
MCGRNLKEEKMKTLLMRIMREFLAAYAKFEKGEEG